MRVRDVVAVNLCRVAFNRILGHRVGQLLPVLIRRPLAEAVAPLAVLVGLDFLAGNFRLRNAFALLVQANGDA